MITGSGLTFLAPNGTSPSLYDEELLHLMRLCGFYRLCLSIDVASPAAVRQSRKPVKLSRMRTIVRHANRMGFWTYATILIGFPDETKQQIREAIRWAWNLKLDTLRFFIPQPLWGSELFLQMQKEGRVTDRTMRELPTGFIGAVHDTDHATREELNALRDHAELGYARAHLLHFLQPSYWLELLPKFWGWRRFWYGVRLILKSHRIHIRFKP
jgi:hypothetical protein